MFLSLQAFTLKCFRQKRIDNSFLAVAFCPVYTAPFCQRKPIKQMECGRGVLRRAHMYVLVRTKRQRKRKFFLIDVVVGLLVAFSASMKAQVRSYQKHVSVFGCLHSIFTVSVFEVSTLVSGFNSLHFHRAFSPFQCKRETKMERKVCIIKQKRFSVNAALIFCSKLPALTSKDLLIKLSLYMYNVWQ